MVMEDQIALLQQILEEMALQKDLEALAATMGTRLEVLDAKAATQEDLERLRLQIKMLDARLMAVESKIVTKDDLDKIRGWAQVTMATREELKALENKVDTAAITLTETLDRMEQRMYGLEGRGSALEGKLNEVLRRLA